MSIEPDFFKKNEQPKEGLGKEEGAPDNEGFLALRALEKSVRGKNIKLCQKQIDAIKETIAKYYTDVESDSGKAILAYYQKGIQTWQARLEAAREIYEDTPKAKESEAQFQKLLNELVDLKKEAESSPKEKEFSTYAFRMAALSRKMDRLEYAERQDISVVMEMLNYPRLLAALGETGESIRKMRRQTGDMSQYDWMEEQRRMHERVADAYRRGGNAGWEARVARGSI